MRGIRAPRPKVHRASKLTCANEIDYKTKGSIREEEKRKEKGTPVNGRTLAFQCWLKVGEQMRQVLSQSGLAEARANE